MRAGSPQQVTLSGGALGTTWKAEHSQGVLLLLLLKELRNVSRFSFSLRTATSEGLALKSYSPEQYLVAGQPGKKNAAPSGKKQSDPHWLLDWSLFTK
jgi:hypothetical protein